MRTSIFIPDLKKEQMVTAYAQQRPFRKGGNRLEKVTVNGKIIVHNYGHGGAGVSLAPGSAIVAVNLVEAELNKTPEAAVAVLGSGIIGLFSCFELLKRYPRLKVTVYAEKIPHFGEKNNDKLITSQVAPGFWLPYHYGSNDTALHKHLSSLSLKGYAQLAQRKEYKSILKEVQMVDITDKDFKKDYFSVLTEELKPSYKEGQVRVNDTITVKCREFTTFKIDMQPFLQNFIQELKTKGVSFVEKKVQKKLEAVSEGIVFNCTGLGSKVLFGDTDLMGIKGHLLEFKNSNPLKYDCFVRANFGSQAVHYYMHDTRIILGLTRETVDDCKVEASQVDLLLQAHRGVLQKLGLQKPSPKL